MCKILERENDDADLGLKLDVGENMGSLNEKVGNGFGVADGHLGRSL
jgi:hypothetical protein